MWEVCPPPKLVAVVGIHKAFRAALADPTSVLVKRIGKRDDNLLAGSYVLGSVPRTVFVMQAASDDVTEDRIVWTCCKNIDGELGKRSAWIRRNGLFDPLTDFDWEAWNKDEKSIIVGVEIVPQIITQIKTAAVRHAIFCAQKLRKKGRPGGLLSVELMKRSKPD
jgi:hypothetical protein